MGISYYAGGPGGDFFGLAARGDAAGDPIQVSTYDFEGPFTPAVTTTGYSINTWHHACGVWASSSDRRAFIDGGSKGTDSTDNPISNTPTHTSVGRIYRNTGDTESMDGSIAEAAIWNVALTDAEVGVLATGIKPTQVRPENIVLYVPLVRDTDKDLIGGLSFSKVGSPAISRHTRVYYPRK
jgi:hypothetical protein